jgi:hypothetical protein
MASGVGDQGSGDFAPLSAGSEFEALEAEVVNGAEVSAGDLVHRVVRFVEKDLGFGARESKAVLEVGPGLISGEQRQSGDVCKPSSHGLELLSFEQKLEPGVSSQDDGQDEPGVEIEVGEDPEDGEDLRPHVLRFVEEQDGAQSLVVELGGEAFLEPAQETGIGTDRRQATGEGDLSAHVALGEVGDLDVVDPVSGLGEALFESPQEEGLAAPGGCDQSRRHAVLDGAPQVGKGLFGGRSEESIMHVDLTGEG